jgi:hypothetical protein
VVITSPESTRSPGGVCRPAQMMLLDAQIQELWDALSRYKASLRRVDDQMDVLAQITLADAALRALWGDKDIARCAAEIDDILEGALRARTRAVGAAALEEPPCSP